MKAQILNQFSRTQLIFGAKAMKILAGSRVAVFGLGGVGSYAVEALARSGVGKLDIIDNDKICLTNLNRQIFATLETIGRLKVEVAKERIRSINPDCEVKTHSVFYSPDCSADFNFAQFDYVVDAIDTVTAKLELILNANAAKTPIISCMGTGNKVDAKALEVSDIYETSVCPLARVMRYECRQRGIKSLKVIYSKEKPRRQIEEMSASCRENCFSSRRDIPGSTAFVPSVAGLIIAGEVVNDLINSRKIH